MHLKISQKNIEIPILPLRDIIVYPNIIVPLFIARKKSIFCLELSMKQNKKIMLVAQKNIYIEEPKLNDLYKIGTISNILQIIKLPNETIKILVEGIKRAKIKEIQNKGKYLLSLVEEIEEKITKNKNIKILTKIIINQFEKYIKLNEKIPIDIINSLNNINNPSKLADTIATNIPLKLKKKQNILELKNINNRLKYIISLIELEIYTIKIEKKIKNRIKKQISKSQREYYLNEQIKAIQKELYNTDNTINEYKIIKKKFKKLKINKNTKKKINIEIKKLKFIPPLSAEYTVIRNYLD